MRLKVVAGGLILHTHFYLEHISVTENIFSFWSPYEMEFIFSFICGYFVVDAVGIFTISLCFIALRTNCAKHNSSSRSQY